MSSIADTITDHAKTASDVAAGAAKVAGKKVTSGYGQALDFVMTGVKLIPTVTAALGFIGLQKKQSNTLGHGLSFGAGLMVGAGAGMLFAPKSGSELRKAILHYLQGTPLENVVETVAKKADAVVHDVSAKVESVKTDLKAAPHNGNRTVS